MPREQLDVCLVWRALHNNSPVLRAVSGQCQRIVSASSGQCGLIEPWLNHGEHPGEQHHHNSSNQRCSGQQSQPQRLRQVMPNPAIHPLSPSRFQFDWRASGRRLATYEMAPPYEPSCSRMKWMTGSQGEQSSRVALEWSVAQNP